VGPQLFPDRAPNHGQRNVVTIGNFDGVHRGHQYLIETVVKTARSRGVGSVVLTFDPLPLEVLRPEASQPRLTTTQDRLAMIRANGVDDVVAIGFTDEVAALDATEFVRQVVDAFQPVEIVVGSDFAFGHKRTGNPELLASLGEQYGYGVRIIHRIGDGNHDFSSSRVRTSLADGDVRNAAEMLGRPYFIRGIVYSGKRRGRELGFPTANLAIEGKLAIPADGIYAAFTQIKPGGEPLPSMVYVGTNPTFNERSRAIEVNLLDFDGDLYGSELTVLFIDQVRGDQWFSSAQELVDQMRRDQVRTEQILDETAERWLSPDLRAILRLEKGALTGDR
jgi:riboflavin kinase/FMN adenylyltransferase